MGRENNGLWETHMYHVFPRFKDELANQFLPNLVLSCVTAERSHAEFINFLQSVITTQ